MKPLPDPVWPVTPQPGVPQPGLQDAPWMATLRRGWAQGPLVFGSAFTGTAEIVVIPDGDEPQPQIPLDGAGAPAQPLTQMPVHAAGGGGAGALSQPLGAAGAPTQPLTQMPADAAQPLTPPDLLPHGVCANAASADGQVQENMTGGLSEALHGSGNGSAPQTGEAIGASGPTADPAQGCGSSPMTHLPPEYCLRGGGAPVPLTAALRQEQRKEQGMAGPRTWQNGCAHDVPPPTGRRHKRAGVAWFIDHCVSLWYQAAT